MEFAITPIAHIESDFEEKFGIPRQAGLVDALEARIVFEPAFRNRDALRGIEGFSHLWLIWQFSQAVRPAQQWTPTVRPPRLGGNERMGVFATRSPFRPNALGLSCVRLLGVEEEEKLGAVLRVGGADLLNGTPIFDIKPYIPYADCRPEAAAGWTAAPETEEEAVPPGGALLRVQWQPGTWETVPEEKREALSGVLANDPRPRYQKDPERVYGMRFAGLQIRFRVNEDELTVLEVSRDSLNIKERNA